MKKHFAYVAMVLLVGCVSNGQEKKEKKNYPVTKSESQWQEVLTELEYHVLREAGTEPAFSSPLDKNYKPGTYYCKACNVPLYASEHKYDSKSGWPSFDCGMDKNLEYRPDNKLGYNRTEVLCANCGSHLGHIFDDGPKETTAKRHCINGVALKFIPKDEER